MTSVDQSFCKAGYVQNFQLAKVLQVLGLQSLFSGPYVHRVNISSNSGYQSFICQASMWPVIPGSYFSRVKSLRKQCHFHLQIRCPVRQKCRKRLHWTQFKYKSCVSRLIQLFLDPFVCRVICSKGIYPIYSI